MKIQVMTSYNVPDGEYCHSFSNERCTEMCEHLRINGEFFMCGVFNQLVNVCENDESGFVYKCQKCLESSGLVTPSNTSNDLTLEQVTHLLGEVYSEYDEIDKIER